MIDLDQKLSPHFTLREMCKSRQHPDIYNIPPYEVVENLKYLCLWLEKLRAAYNRVYGDGDDVLAVMITSGYRSKQLNKAVGGAKDSNHLTGSAADIRCFGVEQAIRYYALLLDIFDQANHDFDELILERKGMSYWVHLAVRKDNNRRRRMFIGFSDHILC